MFSYSSSSSPPSMNLPLTSFHNFPLLWFSYHLVTATSNDDSKAKAPAKMVATKMEFLWKRPDNWVSMCERLSYGVAKGHASYVGVGWSHWSLPESARSWPEVILKLASEVILKIWLYGNLKTKEKNIVKHRPQYSQGHHGTEHFFLITLFHFTSSSLFHSLHLSQFHHLFSFWAIKIKIGKFSSYASLFISSRHFPRVRGYLPLFVLLVKSVKVDFHFAQNLIGSVYYGCAGACLQPLHLY